MLDSPRPRAARDGTRGAPGRRARRLVFGAPAESVDAAWGAGAAQRAAADAAQPYWEAGGVDNLAAFLALAVAARQRMQGLPAQDVIAVPAVRPAPAAGIYHPRAAQPFASLADYLKWYRQAGIVADGAPLVGIAFYATHYRQRDLAHIDALIAALEHQGVGAVPVFGWPLSGLDALVTQDGASPLRVLLALNLTIPRAEDKDWLARHGLHTINLIATRDSEAGWRADVRGIAGERLPLLLTAPERSGATEPILFATQEGEEGGKASAAVPERVEAIVARVRRWIALQDKPPASKHVAVLYYNNPPGRGNLGASYLATLPSLTQILQRLRAAGYRTGGRSNGRSNGRGPARHRHADRAARGERAQHRNLVARRTGAHGARRPRHAAAAGAVPALVRGAAARLPRRRDAGLGAARTQSADAGA